MSIEEKREIKSTRCAVAIMRLIRANYNEKEPDFIAGEISEIINIHHKLPTDKELAIEVLARYAGNSRGTPIAKNAFIDGVNWCKKEFYNCKVE